MVMKIQNHETQWPNIPLNTFTFPHNPQVFDDDLTKNWVVTEQPYVFPIFNTSRLIRNKKRITINGHFDGTGKDADYADLSRHCMERNIKRLFFSDSRFAIVLPETCKRTHSGGRTNFIDYSASFISPFAILFNGDTLRSSTGVTSAENEGEVFTPFLRIQGDVTASTPVSIEDNQGNGFAFTPTITGEMKVFLIHLDQIANSNFITEYIYAEVVQEGSITAFGNAGGGQTTVTSAGHGRSNGDKVSIEGTTEYDGDYTISGVTANTFVIDIEFVSTDTGNWEYRERQNLKYVSDEGDLLLGLNAGQRMNQAFIPGNLVGFSSGPVFYFRDAYTTD